MTSSRDVSDVNPDFPTGILVVNVSGTRPTHLAGVTVPFQYLSAHFCRNRTSEGIRGPRLGQRLQAVLAGAQSAVVIV